MKPIRFTAHLEFRLKFRRIPRSLPEKIYRVAKERFWDRETGYLVAVARIRYNRSVREMSLVYQETSYEARLITIHPLKTGQKEKRLTSGRWQKI